MKKKVFLQPGEISFETEPSQITTIVGSCIAVCLWDKQRALGGMCHYYLPVQSTQGTPENNYGQFAIPNLIKLFKANGCRREDLIAKVVGGGHVIDVNLGADKDVGEANTKLAFATLQKFGIPVEGKAVGGPYGKKISFNTDTGEVNFQNIVKSCVNSDAKIKVFVIDGAVGMRAIVRRMIERDPEIEVIGEAADPLAAMAQIKDLSPDVITLDLKMDRIDGKTFIKEHLSKLGKPFIIISGMTTSESNETLEALELGAFDYIRKPSFNDMESITFDLQQMIKAAHLTKGKFKMPKLAMTASSLMPGAVTNYKCNSSIILIGSSTGGTEAVKDILVALPEDVPPILIVQHMPPVFTTQFAQRLNELCKFEVVEAQEHMIVKPKTAYLAPGGYHMALKEYKEQSNNIHIRITDDPPVNRFKPSVDYMFFSASPIRSKKMLAIILTGMGSDGARGMLDLRNNRVHTIAQDSASSVVDGMPKAARDMGAACEVRSLYDIPNAIMQWLAK